MPASSGSGWKALGQSSATLLLTLAARAAASQRVPELGLQDPLARRIAADCPLDLSAYSRDPGFVRGVVLRSLIFDQQARRHRQAGALGAVTLGAGLCTRWSRLPPVAGETAAHWLNVDLPDVIDLRRACLRPQEGGAVLAASLTSDDWLDAAAWPAHSPLLVLMEGVSPYLPAGDTLGLLRRLAGHCLARGRRAHLVLDYVHPALVQGPAAEVGGMRLPVVGGFAQAQALLAAHPDIRLHSEHHPFARFSEGHAGFDAAFRAQHRAAPYAIACLDIGHHESRPEPV
ncbi:MAG: class I SAM-dependent methyltransferase [Curvibacter sp.]|nr:class I SAM-dependent methyltransferase [Curvibacter sp.]